MYTTSFEKSLWRVLWIIIIAVILWGMFGDIVKGLADSDSIVAICDTVDNNAVSAYDGHSVDSSDANSRHCVIVGNESPAKKQNDTVSTKNAVQPILVSNNPTVVPTVENVPTQVPTVTVHCNNGEGNGSEGCSPANSDHANNDENNTTPKQDQSHPANSMAVVGLSYMILTIKKGRKEYQVLGVRSWEYSGKFLLIYTQKDESAGYDGELFLVKNARVIFSHVTYTKIPYSWTDESVKAILK